MNEIDLSLYLVTDKSDDVEKFLNTINRISIDERPKLNKKDERENKRTYRHY